MFQLGVREHGAACQQPLEAVLVLPFEARQIVGAELVDRDEQHQFDLRVGGRPLRAHAGGAFSSGHREWQKGLGSFSTYVEQPAAATSAWAAENSFVVKQCFYETPFYVTHKLRFDGNQLFYDAESNVGFRNTKQPHLVGRAE